MATPQHDQKYFCERLRYEPDTGKLYWREHGMLPKNWNTKYANTEAFTSVNNRGYRNGMIDKRSYMAHRVIWVMIYGNWPDQFIDHIDHCRDNNKIENLRNVSRQQNSKNQSFNKANKSGYIGVRWNQQTSKWIAQIKTSGHYYYLGQFDIIENAVLARKAAEKRLGFHDNHGAREKGQ